VAKLRAAFPLFEKVRNAGILESGNALIVAPTATGKSYIGRTILRKAVQRGEKGVHVYLVPYRALASEMYESFVDELNRDAVKAVVRVSTGDHTDPIYPEETDILIATYERFAALLRMPELAVGRVVVDEVHLLADETRGVVVESVLARLKFHKRPTSICALSAVISNPEELGKWLGIPLIIGESADRTVDVEFRCELTDDIDGKLKEEVLTVLKTGDQAIIFCRSKPASQRVAREMKPTVANFLTEKDTEKLWSVATQMAEDDEDAEELLALLSGGMAFHNAGLSRESRNAVEIAFRERCLKAIACTPTLAAGVNLPARLVVVRDIFRTEVVRGFHQKVLLSTGELLNMLGRAGRPGQVDRGRGIALVEKKAIGKVLDRNEFAALKIAIRDGRGNPVSSRLPDSFDSLMRFLLSVTADKGECTLVDLRAAIQQTLWYYESPVEIGFERSFDEDIMEDIPSYTRVTPDMRVDRVWPVADGVAGSVVSGANVYNFSLRFSGEDCTCPARVQWQRREVCKHLACVIHHLLFDKGVDPEIRTRAIYAATHRFRKTLDLGTKIKEAVRILEAWDLLERVPAGFRATAVGALASASWFDLLLFRTADDRIRKQHKVPTPKDVAIWLIEDYFADETKRDRWLKAIDPWLDEVDIKKIKLPEKYRGDFERGLDELGLLATLYAEIAASLGKSEVAEVCRLARGCLQYGVKPDLIPLAALRIPQLGRARCRFLCDEKGIRSLEDLSKADPKAIVGLTAPLVLTKQWVEVARNMMKVRGQIIAAPEEKRNREVDEFLTKFQVDQLSLFGEDGIITEKT
jgi:replicative superfamily II helicase